MNSKISDKDKKDWKNFISSKDEIPNKDLKITKDKIKKKIIKKIDLHGFSLENANKVIEEFITQSFEKGVNKIIVITGEGLRSKNDFLKGAQIAYERIITDFASGNLKNIKSLLSKKVFDQFNEALKERKKSVYISKTIFIGINSALIKEHQQINNILEVTVDFISEIISCVKDNNDKIISGDSEKSKKVFDTWKFSKDSRSNNPNWLLTDTQI